MVSRAAASVLASTHHSDSVRGQQLLWAHGCDVGHVGEDEHEGDHRDGDEDGTREVPEDGKIIFCSF